MTTAQDFIAGMTLTKTAIRDGTLYRLYQGEDTGVSGTIIHDAGATRRDDGTFYLYQTLYSEHERPHRSKLGEARDLDDAHSQIRSHMIDLGNLLLSESGHLLRDLTE